jgi:hypothetical protein
MIRSGIRSLRRSSTRRDERDHENCVTVIDR